MQPVERRRPARRAPRPPAAGPRSAARPARAARRAWSRSRRRRPPAPRPSASSSPIAESTRIGISLHGAQLAADLDPAAVGQHQVDDRGVRRADGRRRRAPPAPSRSPPPRSRPRAARPSARAGSAARRRRRARGRPALLTSCEHGLVVAPRSSGKSIAKTAPLAGQRLGPTPRRRWPRRSPLTIARPSPEPAWPPARCPGRTARTSAPSRRAGMPGPAVDRRGPSAGSPTTRARTWTGCPPEKRTRVLEQVREDALELGGVGLDSGRSASSDRSTGGPARSPSCSSAARTTSSIDTQSRTRLGGAGLQPRQVEQLVDERATAAPPRR